LYAMSSCSTTVEFGSELRACWTAFLCAASISFWTVLTASGSILFPVRVKPKSSAVRRSTSAISGRISSSSLFMQRLRCLNCGHLSKYQVVISLPSESRDTVWSRLSTIGTGSSGFFYVLFFLFCSMIVFRCLIFSWCASTWSAENSSLPMHLSSGLTASVVRLFLARPRYSSVLFVSKTGMKSWINVSLKVL